jgi:tmRNA-binding protein
MNDKKTRVNHLYYKQKEIAVLIMKMQKKEKKIVCFCLIFSKNTSK